MAFLKSAYIPEGGGIPSIFDKRSTYRFLKVGRIVDVNYDRYLMKIAWVGKESSGYQDTTITFPYAGPRGMIGALPEKGTLGVFYWLDEGSGRGTKPLLLACLPNTLDLGLFFNENKKLPDSLTPEDENILRHKFRKLGPGDMIMASSLGAEVFVNSDIQLLNDNLNEFMMRTSDQAIISTSLNNYIFAGGVNLNAGLITRNDAVIFNESVRDIALDVREATLTDGRRIVYAVTPNTNLTSESEYYNEYRVSVDEKSNGLLNSNNINNMVAGSPPPNPLVNFVLGTYVGNDIKDLRSYGRILKASLFASPNDQVGEFKLEGTSGSGLDEPARLGLAYSLDFKSGTFMGVDKEGHHYVHLAASSTTNTLGADRSMTILAEGSLKEKWGRDQNQLSWDLKAEGGVRWDIGSSNFLNKGRSINIKTSKGINLDVLSPDNDGFAKTENLKGSVLEKIDGIKISTVSAQESVIEGLKTEVVLGSADLQYLTDLTVNVLGISTENATAEKLCTFGKRKTTIVAGDDSLTILKGDLSRTLLLGSKKTLLTKGDISEKIVAGNHKVLIGKGNDSVVVANGNISRKALSGSVQVTGVKSIGMTSATKINATAPTVNLKSASTNIGAVAISPVVGTLTHNDYITGLPLRGSFSVKMSV